MWVKKVVSGMAGIVMLLAMAAAPALAGHGNGGGNAFGFGKTKKHGGGHHSEASGNTHANKHGELRGLQRANDVAGTHGQKGRTNAAAHDSTGGSGGSDSE